MPSTLTPATLVIDLLPISTGPLTQVSVADFNQDTYNDLLTLSAEINALTLISGKDGGINSIENAMRKVPSETQIFSILPMDKLWGLRWECFGLWLGWICQLDICY